MAAANVWELLAGGVCAGIKRYSNPSAHLIAWILLHEAHPRGVPEHLVPHATAGRIQPYNQQPLRAEPQYVTQWQKKEEE